MQIILADETNLFKISDDLYETMNYGIHNHDKT